MDHVKGSFRGGTLRMVKSGAVRLGTDLMRKHFQFINSVSIMITKRLHNVITKDRSVK